MAASDHAILRGRTHIPTKRSLLELSSQDALLAHNKLLSKLEVALFVVEFTSLVAVSKSNHKSTESAIKNLEIQVGQLAKQLVDKPSRSFGANTENNPKEECKAVMTRGRRAIISEDEGRLVAENQELVVEEEKEEEKEEEEDKEDEKKRKSERAHEKKKKAAPSEGKKVPYPLVPSKKDKERHLARFLDIFKKLEITMPFGEALQQMPFYSKFLKDMLMRKIKYIHSDTIVVEGNCSVVIQRILPPKHKDLRSVTIPCSIGAVSVGKALIDLGASINLMSLSMCRRIGELEVIPTRITLQLADRSITRPYGVIEDVLVRFKHFTFPADFVVMDIEEDAEIPLILGRPFLLTASCVVDMGKGKLEMGIEDQKISFDLFDEEKKLLDQNVCLQVKEFAEEVLKVGTKFDPDP
ncbi:uncharacterized protein [Glycine max]|uniref:uncharacterized protein n=1 Tax=Glycine max TaxID=3847 RepID=UPI0003DE7A72|nr:uncharacterized protein LOC102670028 [Glycine max]|eukprot:XP_006574165.1 uncharacterized protein LOC102670028 [Glycine max]